MKPVHKRPQVILDVADFYGWIAADNPEVAESFLTEVDRTFEQIRERPGRGWNRPWRNEKLRGMRSWRVEGYPNFLVFYREEVSTIEVYAVLRAARHLERALRRR